MMMPALQKLPFSGLPFSGICGYSFSAAAKSAAGRVRIPLYSITDWHRSPISDSHPFDQPGT
ncbi:TPA: hypothetical protein IDY16_000974 [Escherichia coli]|nr:hypothetical protein [Escherichia coli]HCO4510747.1 hypothetical protein [Escherichia coli]